MQMTADKLYWESYQRNIGIFTRAEQKQLKNSKIAIAGMGGVGGIYLINLIRAGIENFNISDPDIFEHKNMNRQYGAMLDTIGGNKAQVMKKIALSINPGADITIYKGALGKDNIDSFIDGCDLVLDAIDILDFEVKSMVHDTARKNNLYSIRAVPLGFGATMQVFSPGSMRFSEYFRLDETADITKRFENILDGHAPKRIHEEYMGAGAYKMIGSDGTICPPPSFCPSVVLASSLVTTEAVLILLGKRPSSIVPQCTVVDLFSRKFDVSENPAANSTRGTDVKFG